MPQRDDDPWRLKPTAHDVSGCRWELIEPMLRQLESAPRQSDAFFGCWKAVKAIRTVHDKDGEWLTWIVYGKALDGPYESIRVTRRTTCPHCGHEAASLPSTGNLLQRVCRNCRLDHQRAMDRLAARRRRRRSGEVVDRSEASCAHCGNPFTPKRSTATFCSTKCRVGAHRAAKVQGAGPAVEVDL